MCFFKRTRLAAGFAVGQLHAKQFDFHSLRRDRRSVDNDERP